MYRLEPATDAAYDRLAPRRKALQQSGHHFGAILHLNYYIFQSNRICEILNGIPAIALPVISRGDMLERCLRSIDYPVLNLVVFVNSDDPSITAALTRVNNSHIKNLVVQKRMAYGRGCGPALNEVVKAFPHGPYWMLIGADNYFHPGTLQQIDNFCRTNQEKLYIWADDVIPMLTIKGVQQVGLFDENIYPCYFEDADYSYRVKLAGQSITAVGIPIGHGSTVVRGNITTNSDMDLKFRNEISYSLNREYYKQKWGGIPGEETYTTPFNIPGLPVSYWSFDPQLRVERLWEEIGDNFSEQRRQFIVSFINYVTDELDSRLAALKESPTPDNYNGWRLGVISLVRHIAAIPSDCLEQVWSSRLKATIVQHTDPKLIPLASSDESELVTYSELRELFGTKFDLQSRVGIWLLTGDRRALDEVGGLSL